MHLGLYSYLFLIHLNCIAEEQGKLDPRAPSYVQPRNPNVAVAGMESSSEGSFTSKA